MNREVHVRFWESAELQCPALLTRFWSPITLLATVLAAAPMIALAKPPARIDNIWNWRHHEPSPMQIRRAEHAKPILPLPRQRRATTAEVEDLYRHLMRSEGSPPR